MSHREHLFTFYLKVGIPQFAAEKISFCFKYVLCYPSFALFSAPSCTVIIFNGAPSSAPVYFLYKGWYSIKNYIYHLQLKEFSRSTPSYAVIHLNGATSSTPVILFRVGKVGIASGFISIIYSFEGVFSLHSIVCSY